MRITMTALVLIFIGSNVRADDWPQWLGLKRDGSTKEVVKPWKAPLKILWKVPVGEGHGGPVVADGKLYLFYRTAGKDEESLAVFDIDSGKLITDNSYPRRATNIPFGNGPRSVPIVDGDRV